MSDTERSRSQTKGNNACFHLLTPLIRALSILITIKKGMIHKQACGHTRSLGVRKSPLTMMVLELRSVPSVTSSAVERDPKPLGPALPVR